MTKELALRPYYAQYPNPNPKPELFGQTRPEPDPKSKSPTRQSLTTGHELMCPSSWKLYVDNFPFFYSHGALTESDLFGDQRGS